MFEIFEIPGLIDLLEIFEIVETLSNKIVEQARTDFYFELYG